MAQDKRQSKAVATFEDLSFCGWPDNKPVPEKQKKPDLWVPHALPWPVAYLAFPGPSGGWWRQPAKAGRMDCPEEDATFH